MQEKLKFYIGGVQYETYTSTLVKRCGHQWLTQVLTQGETLGHKEYFFDRNPSIFSCVLDYCRTGQLHVPHNICGPMITDELEFWNLSPALVRPCCWAPFTTDEHLKHAGKPLPWFILNG